MICERPGLAYESGCRCLRCRVTNAAEGRRRRAVLRTGGKNIVDPQRARAHLEKLSKLGVGRKSVSAACDVSVTVLQRIRQGRRSYILRETERKILAVTAEAYSGGSVIDGSKTWWRVDLLLRSGFTKAELARRLGLPKPELRWGREKVTGVTAVKVERFYQIITAGDEEAAA